MAGMSGGSMLRTRRKDVNVKPNRRLDRKSSRGMLYENEELRLRTININAEVERGQSDIKKLKRENEQLKREVGALRGEYDKLERLLHQRHQHNESPDPENQDEDKISITSCCSECSVDCCKICDDSRSETINCDNQNAAVTCSKYPECHSMDIAGKEKESTENIVKSENCQSDAESNKCQHCDEKQPEKTIDNLKNSEPQTSKTCERLEDNKRHANKKPNIFDFNFKMEHNRDVTSDGNKRSSSMNELKRRRDKNNLNALGSSGNRDERFASNCSQFFSCQNVAADSDSAEEDLVLPNCRRIGMGIAGCCGTILSPVPEEGSIPRSPLWITDNNLPCNCQPEDNQEKENNIMEHNSTSEPSRSKEYYKAVVTVPMSSHIPIESNFLAESTATTTTGISHAMQSTSEGISLFPKTGLDILIKNNGFENIQEFSLAPPVGFIIPPPLFTETNQSEGQYQIVPNVDFINSEISNLNIRNQSDTNVPTIDSTMFCSTSNNLPPNVIPYFPVQTFIQNNGAQVVTNPNNVVINNNVQNNAIITTTGLIYSSNCPIMSSMVTQNFAIPSSSTTNTEISNNSSSILPECFSNISSTLKDNMKNNIGDDISSIITESGRFKDSFFVCKTRKVIQQMTTVQNSNTNAIQTSPCGCMCKCNLQYTSGPNQQISSETVSSVSDVNNKNPTFKTEKSIELNYDYPKPINHSVSNVTNGETSGGLINKIQETKTTTDSTQTIHTTTEVNSTLYLFERKNIPQKSKSKQTKYMRSNSAPVEISSDEPIYATVNKLPKKLKRLNIKNLEIETKYVPPDEDNKNSDKILATDVKDNENKEIIKEKSDEGDDTVKSCDKQVNGKVTENTTKSDSFSESSDRITGVPKSPGTVRKKKKFSIRFKRKLSKNSANGKTSVERTIKNNVSQENIVANNSQSASNNKLVVEINSESDKLIDASSSLDSPDIKLKNTQPHYCKIHGKPKHSHRHHYKSGCESPRCYRTEYPHSRYGGSYKPGSTNNLDSGARKQLPRCYLKQDSYQEMTTSHSERERTNSLSSSGHSNISLNSKARSGSHSRREGSIPWCGCWGNSCL